jgi:hypothetical protein
MSQDRVFIETSFADAITIIVAADELSEQTRRHWTTSLRQIAKALDKPLEVIPARYSAVRADLGQLHHAPAGLTAKTLQKPQEQREERLAMAGAGKGHSRARGTLDAAMGRIADQDQGSACSLEAVVLYAVLLGEPHRSGRGGRGRRRPLHELSFANRETFR